MKNLTVAFDIGHSSIGWGVLSSPARTKENPVPVPNILGAGSVLFPKDDCLAGARRDHRRSRRNIRSTRQRIERLKKLLLHLGVLTAEELDQTGHSAPHHLAARALRSDSATLTWLEIWNLLRWYAHNRGYDGNSRWSRQEDDSEDTEKERTALNLMKEHNTSSMAETICGVLGIDPMDDDVHSPEPYKTHNAAFPRHIILNEVTTLLEKHKGHLEKLDQGFIDTLIASDTTKGKQAWKTIDVPSIQLPRRYFGGLLFGQLIPRFDNRIIATCPISEEKVPNKACLEFLNYRWAMLIANIKADGKTLNSEQRQDLHHYMQGKGRLTPSELRIHVEQITGTKKTNIKASFEIHPDSKEALELDPALGYAGTVSENKKNALHPYWKLLPEIVQQRIIGRWKKNRPVHLQWMLEQLTKEKADPTALLAEIEKTLTTDAKKKKPSFATRNHLLRKTFAPKPLSGRAPYGRKVMKDVLEFVLTTDRHPTEAPKANKPAGPIYRSPEVLKNERNTPIAKRTNNHLVRQRIDILLRLTKDIIAEYAADNPEHIKDIVVEVASDLKTMSGLTAKEMAGALTKRLSHFTKAVDYLEKNAPSLTLNGSLIRKCRIAMDMDWHCPFTGKRYDAQSLPHLELEHIIPYADRPTNSLDSLVLTTSRVNRLKGKRTGMQFIQDMAGNEEFHTAQQYKKFVEKLKTANKDTFPDDSRRQHNRKKLLLVEEYETKDLGFTQGALTQTSHLNRLSARSLESLFTDPNTQACSVKIHSIPGQVTAATRRAWRLVGTLAKANPDIEEEQADGYKKIKTKNEIRNITHLHHALDAATLALTQHYLPGTLRGQAENQKGAIWQAMLKRNKTDEQIQLLMRTGMFKKCYKTNHDKAHELEDNGKKKLDAYLMDIDTSIKEELSNRLAEKRVVQHIPADQSGAALELNPWRVLHIDGDPSDPKTLVTLSQTASSINKEGTRDKKKKEKKERAGKLIGLQDGKLSKNKSVLILNANYGLALDPQPAIIPFHNVPTRINQLCEDNDGEMPRILRNGMLIRISNWEGKEGIWKIFSTKATLTLDLGFIDAGSPTWREVSVKSLLKKNALEILTPTFIGVPDTPH